MQKNILSALKNKTHKYWEKCASLVKNRHPLFIYPLLFLIISPILVWILMDKKVWRQDAAYYGFNSVNLFYTFFNEPSQWLDKMVSVTPIEAPMMVWIGQFFVPIGSFIGSIDIGLLLSVFITLFLVLVLLFKIFQRLFKKTSISFAGCLVVAAAPLCAALSTKYYVEPLQLLAVVWFVYIMVHAPKWDSVFIVLQLIAASSFAMLVKVSSPAYCLGPGIVALVYVFRLRSSRIRFTKRHLIISFFAGPLAFAYTVWYGNNLMAVINYARHSAFDFGVNDIFWRKFAYWLGAVQKSFFLPGILLCIIPLFMVAVYFYRKKEIRDLANICAFVAVFQVILVLSIFSFVNNQISRFLLPLLPYFAILICWSLVQINKIRWASFVIVIFVFQLLMVDAIAFGIIERKPYVDKWLWAIDRDGSNLELIDEVVNITSSKDTKDIFNLNLICVHYDWFQWCAFNYHAIKKYRSNYINYSYQNIKYSLGKHYKNLDIEKICKKVLSCKPAYLLSINPNHPNISINKHKNQVYHERLNQLLEKVKSSEMFEPVWVSDHPEILIFKYVKPDNDGYQDRGKQ